jgi:hypothetical protein
MMNTPSGSFSPLEEIPQDTPVYDVNAEKVGNVIASAMQNGYFVVEKGVIFTQELYIPAPAVLGRDTHGVRLRLSKEELKDDRWKQPPGGTSSASQTNVPPTTAQPGSIQNQGQAINQIPQEPPPPPPQR